LGDVDILKADPRPSRPELHTAEYQAEIGNVYDEKQPLDYRPVIKGCPFFKNEFATGGKTSNQGLWMQAALACTFMQDGREVFHALSNKHAGYSPEQADDMFDRKIEDRLEKDLGWPGCQTFENNGSAQCAGCRHKDAIRSPLNLAVPEAPAAAAPPTPDKPAIPSFKLVDTYEPVERDAPELAKLNATWMARIFDEDPNADPKKRAFGVTCELVRAGVDDNFIARVLMTTSCGKHIQERPTQRLPRALRRAHEVAIDPDLEKMNSTHAVLTIKGKTRVATWGTDPEFPGRQDIMYFQEFGDFKNLHSNRRKSITTTVNGKQTTDRIPMGAWWLGQEHRRQYSGGRKFMPRRDEEVVNETLNMWTGFAVHPRKPEGRSGASGCQLFLDHGFKIICNGNERDWDYEIKRRAWIAQNRQRSEIAAAYGTEAEATGKGFWTKHNGRLYGMHYMQVNNPTHVIGQFNPHLETLLHLVADEALFVNDPRHRNALFGLITEPTITIEPKHIGMYTAPNYLNIDIISNSKHFIPASGTARRFFIPTVSENRRRDFEYFDTVEAQLLDGGYEAYLYHLLHEVDLRDFNVRAVPRTAALAEQQRLSGDSFTSWLQACVNEDGVVGVKDKLEGWISTNDLARSYIEYCKLRVVRPVNDAIFGRNCTESFGPNQRHTLPNKMRPYGYILPDGDALQRLINKKLGMTAA
jgi:hypothetical protein